MASVPSLKKRKTNDLDIRTVLLNRLEKHFPAAKENLIVEEFGCESARVDVAIVNGSLHGYEIKSDQDTFVRLATQVPAYGKIFDHMTVVVGIWQEPLIADQVPKWWSIMVARFCGSRVVLKTVRRGTTNPERCKATIARLLWTNEAASILRRKGYAVPHSYRAYDLWNALTDKLEDDELSLEVRNALRARAKLKAERSQTLRDDSYTIESNVRQRRQSANRQWLALQSARLHS